jgi:hypothetical protein
LPWREATDLTHTPFLSSGTEPSDAPRIHVFASPANLMFSHYGVMSEGRKCRWLAG